MENSPAKGYLQDHTVISATHSKIFTESKGITPDLHWQDQDQNVTRSKQKPNNATGCKNNQQSMACQSNGDLCDSDALQWLKIFQGYCSSSPKHLAPHPVFLSTPDRQVWKDNWQTHNGLSFFSWVFIPFHSVWESCNAWSRVWGCILGRGKRPSTVSAEFIPKCKPHWAVEHDNKNLLT